MKKLLLIALAALFTVAAVSYPSVKAEAQSIKLTTKTITTADTVTFTNVGSRVKAFQYTFTETSGTTAGKVYLEGTINGTYVLLDSLTLADVTTAQTKVFPLTATTYLTYRFRNTNTSSATGAVRAAWIRRTDE
ncbi:MAG: hypothetical protein ACT4OJ_08775 [Bacteroidota bacterium]